MTVAAKFCIIWWEEPLDESAEWQMLLKVKGLHGDDIEAHRQAFIDFCKENEVYDAVFAFNGAESALAPLEQFISERTDALKNYKIIAYSTGRSSKAQVDLRAALIEAKPLAPRSN